MLPTQPMALRSEPRWRNAIYPALAVLITLALGAARLIGSHTFFFADDTQTGAFGQWWEFGDRILSGTVTVLDPHAWQAGNLLAEGQWGLWNPLTWLIALGARASENPVVLVTVVKLAFLAIMALGVYLLARSFGANPAWSLLAAVLAPLGGFTMYMDATSWATGLFNAALLPVVWWALARVVTDARSPLPYLLSAYVLVTFGYVFGVAVLALVLVTYLAQSWVQRDWPALRRVVIASAYAGFLTVMVFLPGVLTAPVTERAGFDIVNAGFLNADLTDLAASASPTATGTIGAWSGIFTNAPLPYIAWVIPMFALFLPTTRAVVRRLVPLLVVGALVLVVVLGPSHLGPIRWPIRLIPYVVIVVVVIFAVVATHAWPQRVTWRRMWLAQLALVVMTWLAWTQTPNALLSLAAVCVVQAAAIVAVTFIATSARLRWEDARRLVAVTAGLVVVTALLVVPQVRFFPTTPLPQFAVPDSVSDMRTVLADGLDDAIVVGDIYSDGGNRAAFDEILLGNLWYLSPTRVSSLYTVLPFTAYARDLCTDLRGSTCAAAYETLMERDEATGSRVVDLLGVNSVVVIKSTFGEQLPAVPIGWSLEQDEDFTWLLRRSEPIPGAGGVSWMSSGTELDVVSQTDTRLELRVRSLGAAPAVVLSRLAWPGYTVSGATFSDPVRDYLIRVDLAGLSPGDTVSIEFRPPGAPLIIAALVVSLGILVGWPAGHAIHRRRRGHGMSPRSREAEASY